MQSKEPHWKNIDHWFLYFLNSIQTSNETRLCDQEKNNWLLLPYSIVTKARSDQKMKDPCYIWTWVQAASLSSCNRVQKRLWQLCEWRIYFRSTISFLTDEKYSSLSLRYRSFPVTCSTQLHTLIPQARIRQATYTESAPCSFQIWLVRRKLH